MRREGAPLRFIVIVLSLWGGARAFWLIQPIDGTPAIASHPDRPADNGREEGALAGVSHWMAQAFTATRQPEQLTLTLPPPAYPHRIGNTANAATMDLETVLADTDRPELLTPVPPPSRGPRLDMDQAVHAASRWSGSAWVFAREGSGNRSLAALGQLGGSQAGARVRWQVNPGEQLRTALYGRVSTPLDDLSGAEAAIGAEWHPLPGKPVWVAAERRVAIGKQGRNAWSAYVAGGVWKPGLPMGLTLDGYGQAGVVGTKKRDLFADGALRLSRPVASEQGPRIGGGVWGAAQPGVARLDVGPHARLPVKVAKQPFSISADYRVRVAGDAAPGSGVAVTLASDF